jgi:hypothetical protein
MRGIIWNTDIPKQRKQIYEVYFQPILTFNDETWALQRETKANPKQQI